MDGYRPQNASSFADGHDVKTIVGMLYLLGEDPSDPAMIEATAMLCSRGEFERVVRGLREGDREYRARVLASYLAGLIHGLDEWSMS